MLQIKEKNNSCMKTICNFDAAIFAKRTKWIASTNNLLLACLQYSLRVSVYVCQT